MLLSEEEFVVFDLEWTIKDKKHYIIEIGALKIRDGVVVGRFDKILYYQHKLTPIVQKMTGISEEMLLNGENREETMLNFMLFIENSILVAHDIQNDIKVLKEEFNRLGLIVENRGLCTFKLSKKSFPAIQKHNLNSVSNYFGIEANESHRAFEDAKRAYLIFKKVLENLPLKIDRFDKLKNWRGAEKLKVKYDREYVEVDSEGSYIGYFDGASSGNPGDMGIGYALLSQERDMLFEGAKYIGVGTNNEAEYVSLIALLKLAKRSKISKIEIFGDSQLVIKQLLGEWRVKAVNLQPLYQDAKKLIDEIGNVSLSWVRREENTLADSLSKKGVESGKS